VSTEQTPLADALSPVEETPEVVEREQQGASEAEAGEQPLQGEDPPEGGWTYTAVRAEREKRQAAERRLLELEQERTTWLQGREQQEREAFWNDPEKHLRSMQQTMIQTARQASETRLIAEHGIDFHKEMDAALGEAIKAGDPDIPMLREACLQSHDPARVVLDWYLARTKSGTRPKPPTFPQNLNTARNAGQRSAKVFTGPTPLDDIFDRDAR
jgi:hypothetical protein